MYQSYHGQIHESTSSLFQSNVIVMFYSTFHKIIRKQTSCHTPQPIANHKIKWYQALVIGILMSATIELSQLIFMRGLFEWDDMIHNERKQNPCRQQQDKIQQVFL